MKSGKELDQRISQEIFGGESPVQSYSTNMKWAWKVAEKMKVSLIPVTGGQWFAFIGSHDLQGWDSPQALLMKLESGDFTECGAAVGEDAALVICQAAINAIEKRKHEAPPPTDEPLMPIPPELLN